MSRQSFHGVDGPDASPASHTAYASSTTRTNLWLTSKWTPIPALGLKAGQVWHLRAGGIISTTGTPTIIFNPTFGQSATPSSNVALGASATITLGSGLSSVPWFAEFCLVVRSLGMAASGCAITGNGFVAIGGPAATAGQLIPIGGTVASTADDTAASGLCIDATWGTNSASNTITAQWQLLTSLN